MLLYEQASRGGLRTVAFAPSLGRSRALGRLSSTARRPSAGKLNHGRPLRTGIRPGMALAEAVALYEHAVAQSAGRAALPALHIEAYDPTADRLALERWADWCQRFSPLVALEDAPRPASLLLDISGLAGLFGGEASLAALVAEQWAEQGLTARVAIADTPGAAWAAAHYASWLPSSIVPPSETPAGSLVPPASGLQPLAYLSPLPLAALRLEAGTIQMLNELGVDCIGQLAALPRGMLRGRFGAAVLERLDQLFTGTAEVAVTQKPAEQLSAEQLFEYPTNRQELLETVLEELLQNLTRQLAAQRHGILRLACRLARSEGPPVQFEVGLYRPSGCVRHLLDLVRLRLEALRFRASRRSQVEAVQLSVAAAAPLVAEQQELFERDKPREAPRALAGLVDRLASRLGREAVVRPVLLADVQPEYACQYLPGQCSPKTRPAAGRERAKTKTAQPAAAEDGPAAPAGQRPLRLLAAPLPLDATSVVPDGPPLRFRFQGQEQQIVKTWGPERIETGWWRNQAVGIRRDYYRVETSSGSRFWLFRRLSDGRWFLHGEFE